MSPVSATANQILPAHRLSSIVILKSMKNIVKQKANRPFSQILTSFLIGVLLIVGVSVVASSPVSAAKPEIPVGCPGTKIQGPPSAAQTAVCANIPVGCPGSTQTGARPANFDELTCPYGDVASIVEPECSSQVTDEKARCSVAQECDGGDLSASNCGITRYLILLINVLSGLVGITVVGVMIFAGIQYSVSSGDPGAAAAAKKRISNAILALVLFATMYGFLQWIVPGGVL